MLTAAASHSRVLTSSPLVRANRRVPPDAEAISRTELAGFVGVLALELGQPRARHGDRLTAGVAVLDPGHGADAEVRLAGHEVSSQSGVGHGREVRDRGWGATQLLGEMTHQVANDASGVLRAEDTVMGLGMPRGVGDAPNDEPGHAQLGVAEGEAAALVLFGVGLVQEVLGRDPGPG